MVEFQYSKDISRYVSELKTNIMCDRDSLFHPRIPYNNPEFLEKMMIIETEFFKRNAPTASWKKVDGYESYYGEIAGMISGGDLKYEVLAEWMAEGWLESPPHKNIMLIHEVQKIMSYFLVNPQKDVSKVDTTVV